MLLGDIGWVDALCIPYISIRAFKVLLHRKEMMYMPPSAFVIPFGYFCIILLRVPTTISSVDGGKCIKVLQKTIPLSIYPNIDLGYFRTLKDHIQYVYVAYPSVSAKIDRIKLKTLLNDGSFMWFFPLLLAVPFLIPFLYHIK